LNNGNLHYSPTIGSNKATGLHSSQRINHLNLVKKYQSNFLDFANSQREEINSAAKFSKFQTLAQ